MQAGAAKQAQCVAALQAGVEEQQHAHMQVKAHVACMEATLQALQASTGRRESPVLREADAQRRRGAFLLQTRPFGALLLPLARAAKWLVEMAP